jgi:hypothetical protein
MNDKRRWLPSWQRLELAEKVDVEGWSCRPTTSALREPTGRVGRHRL